ncbi:MAG: endopeptidase La [bacterium]|nr:endopeptidase La [bacterium]
MTDSIGTNEFYSIHVAEPDQDGLITRPLIPLRTMVIYPNVISPIPLTTPSARAAVDAAHRATAITVSVKDSDSVEITPADLQQIGVEVAIGRTLRLPDDMQSVLAQGRRRVEIVEIVQTEPYWVAKARPLDDIEHDSENTDAIMEAVLTMFQRVVEMNDHIPEEVLLYALNAETPGWLADLIASTLSLPLEDRQTVLETLDAEARLRHVAGLLSQELNVLELREEITGQVQAELDRSQREMYLREQMRVIQDELGEGDLFAQEIEEVREQIVKANLPPDIHEKAVKELQRLALMTPMAPEVGIVRTYLDWLTSIPWSNQSEDRLDVAHAKTILDREHYGLPKIKDRILEYIAVRKVLADREARDAEALAKATAAAAAEAQAQGIVLQSPPDAESGDESAPKPKRSASPILCFVGPPGTGKTSLGKSIAAALGRSFVRVSLGGVRDEAEIRGHRRTYIGALPGRIIQTMRRAGTVNPVFVLDEIDKLGMDFRGDPAAALLEILDPEQNNAFSDHYLDVPFDLSKVFFITTANDLEPLPPALLDRLEVIELSGYTEEEKIAIARQFLIPRQLEEHGIENAGISFETPALQTLIREYTYEAGVRNLNREIANVCRKITRQLAEGKKFSRRVTSAQVRRYLGVPPFDDLRVNENDAVGVATGLAWTPYGGDVLTIEVQVLPGKGTLTMTGSLGDVMQESAQAALSYMRSIAEALDIPFDDFEEFDIHVHIPEGAVPKDGPSAGITLATAMISAFTERMVRHDFAMTGEVTIRGKVLPVGGIKEKVLAARRARVFNVILPLQNKKDLEDIPKEALADMTIQFVETMGDVLNLVLHAPPTSELKRDKIRRERDEKDKEAEKSGHEG